MTNEYLRAAQTYDFLGYNDLRRMARMSLEHSFLPGSSLWKPTNEFRPADACSGEKPDASSISSACQKYLDENEKARMQWRLEDEFAKFEKKF
jgi:adenosine deaminase